MHSLYKIIVLLATVTALAVALPSQTPVIGIYTQDSDYPGYENDFTYIAASYVKSMEMSGAQVIPIYYHYNTDQLTEILSQVNGVLFPGGEMPIDIRNQWTSNTKFILEYAMNENSKGNVYPIWATCLGEEAVAYITSLNPNNMSTLTEVHGEQGSPRKLIMTNATSRLFANMSQNLLKVITEGEGVYYFHHRWAVLKDTFVKSVPLSNFWNLVSTSMSPVGEEFVSTLEAKNYPFFLSQYHPEKNSFEWRIPAVRTYEAIAAEQDVFNTFMSYARLNKNTFKNHDDFLKMYIHNFQPLYTTPDYDFVQIYLFNETALVPKVQPKVHHLKSLTE